MFQKAGKVKYIVVGLGNPGAKYTFTRHNAGFLALDFISKTRKFKIDGIKHKSLTGRFAYNEKDGETCGVLFMKPQTFMNNSGEAVRDAAGFYKVPPENIIVISDDASMPAGKIRVRRQGSDGGQRGLRSITEHLHTESFPRIKIGVGEKPHPEYDLADWVLSEFSDAEKKIIFEVFPKADAALAEIIASGNAESAMNKFN